MGDTIFHEIESLLDNFIERAENPIKSGFIMKSKTRKANLSTNQTRALDTCVGLALDQAKLIRSGLGTMNPKDEGTSIRVLKDTIDFIKVLQGLSDKSSCKDFNRVLTFKTDKGLGIVYGKVQKRIKEYTDKKELNMRMLSVTMRAMNKLRKNQESAESVAKLRGMYTRVTGKPLGGGRRRTLRKRSRSRKTH